MHRRIDYTQQDIIDGTARGCGYRPNLLKVQVTGTEAPRRRIGTPIQRTGTGAKQAQIPQYLHEARWTEGNRVVGVFNLTDHNLDDPAEQEALRDMLLGALPAGE